MTLKVQNKVVRHEKYLVAIGQVRTNENGLYVLVIDAIRNDEERLFNLLVLINDDSELTAVIEEPFQVLSSTIDYTADEIVEYFPSIVEAKLVLEGTA